MSFYHSIFHYVILSFHLSLYPFNIHFVVPSFIISFTLSFYHSIFHYIILALVFLSFHISFCHLNIHSIIHMYKHSFCHSIIPSFSLSFYLPIWISYFCLLKIVIKSLINTRALFFGFTPKHVISNINT